MIYKTPININDPYFILKSAGGYYEGIAGKDQVRAGSGLNNCVCAAWGLVAKLENNPKCRIGCGNRDFNAPYNAGEWLERSPDYKQVQEPIEGGIIVYDNHVAFINRVAGDNVYILESGYGSSNKAGIWSKTVKKSENYYRGKIYGNFKGFLAPKETNTKQPITTDEAIDKMADDVIAGLYGNGKEYRKEKLYRAIQKRVNKKLLGR